MFDIYRGFDLLQPLSEVAGFPLDQVNFIACQLAALVFGYFFRVVLTPEIVGVKMRHVIEFVTGFSMLFFCFGIQSFSIVLQTFLCYMIMIFFKPGTSERVVMIVAMTVLSVAHLFRLYYDYAGYTLDVTGPLMMNTQRITCLAFSYADGKLSEEKKNKLTSSTLSRSIRTLPSVLELLSYTFSFHTMVCGPFCFYADYINFIEGKQTFESENTIVPQPFWVTIKKLLSAMACMSIWVLASSTYHVEALLDPENGKTWFQFFVFLTIVATVVRLKYYFAWKLAEAVNVSAGFGFSGFDDKGSPKWNLIDNVDILHVEFATNMKMVFDHWNKMTSSWLRYTVYERTGSTVLVFLTSAFWHGFYPGYYITFVGGALFTNLSRKARYIIRPIFQASKVASYLYDLLTMVVTKVLLSYLAIPFLLLELERVLNFYRSIYFCLHVVGLVFFCLLLVLSKIMKEKKKNVE